MTSDLSGRTTVVVRPPAAAWGAESPARSPRPAPQSSRSPEPVPRLPSWPPPNPNIRTEVADAADEGVAWNLLDQYDPEVLILVAGANQ